MTIFSFVAVAATDQLTMVAHGLVTGAGPVGPYVAGGAIGGLSEANDYYVIRIDADHVKLATSSANALAGAAVDITADHSGFLGIGMPYRRATTYVAGPPGSQVKSADLNAIQDAIDGAKIAPHWRWTLFDARGILATNLAFDNGGGIYDGRARATANAAVLKGFPLGPVPIGYRPIAAAMYAAGTGAAQTLTAILYKNSLAGGITPLGTVSAGASPAAVRTRYELLPLTTVAALVDGESLMVELALGLSTSEIVAFGVRYDKP